MQLDMKKTKIILHKKSIVTNFTKFLNNTNFTKFTKQNETL